ncbi:Oidioi.mRNA.OKI2018_I69.XSR.g13952.t1.cds [Oikopleura dioica]|uniref:Oidioi.mRNA.OKI2018_I69.XSR.g13952.t1.cds n=1 Tax=Oikopleura dioica TaxID=34765 RepID=A0ABN7S8D7_OIKDI|nr:Oidioi.mRNA.OKI2018_I69.XSR.g13952.t1.cds [Oikopleura dioica]
MTKKKGKRGFNGAKLHHFKHIASLLQAASVEGVPAAFQHKWQHTAKKVSDKVVVRLHKSYKRRYCQRCWSSHDKTATIEKNKSGNFNELKCEKCFFTKRLVRTDKAASNAVKNNKEENQS